MATSVFQATMRPLGLTVAPSGGAVPVRRALQFSIQHQNQTQWCWAAVTASVATFYRNQGWTQCRVVSDRLGRSTCCSEGSSSACNRPWYLDQALDRVGNLGDYLSGALSVKQVRDEIDGGRPIGARVAWTGGGGHFVTVTGYSDQGVVDIQDPWFGRSSVDYNSFRSRYQGEGRWTHSYRTKSKGEIQSVTAPAESAFFYL